MLNKLLPRENRFFELFEKQAGLIQKGLDLFGTMLRENQSQKEFSKQMKEMERKCDEITHEVYHLLNNTFVTPFDREDIRTLADSLDDVIDLVEATTARMDIYDLSTTQPEVREMSSVLNHAFSLVAMAISKLNNMKNRADILAICVEVNRLENEGDQSLRLALKRLFKDNTDAMYVMKMKEIYENLENAIDRCEDLANVIETILIKNT